MLLPHNMASLLFTFLTCLMESKRGLCNGLGSGGSRSSYSYWFSGSDQGNVIWYHSWLSHFKLCNMKKILCKTRSHLNFVSNTYLQQELRYSPWSNVLFFSTKVTILSKTVCPEQLYIFFHQVTDGYFSNFFNFDVYLWLTHIQLVCCWWIWVENSIKQTKFLLSLMVELGNLI